MCEASISKYKTVTSDVYQAMLTDYQHFGRYYVTTYVVGTSLINKIMTNNSQKEILAS